jgi:hypothetical protein
MKRMPYRDDNTKKNPHRIPARTWPKKRQPTAYPMHPASPRNQPTAFTKEEHEAEEELREIEGNLDQVNLQKFTAHQKHKFEMLLIEHFARVTQVAPLQYEAANAAAIMKTAGPSSPVETTSETPPHMTRVLGEEEEEVSPQVPSFITHPTSSGEDTAGTAENSSVRQMFTRTFNNFTGRSRVTPPTSNRPTDSDDNMTPPPPTRPTAFSSSSSSDSSPASRNYPCVVNPPTGRETNVSTASSNNSNAPTSSSSNEMALFESVFLFAKQLTETLKSNNNQQSPTIVNANFIINDQSPNRNNHPPSSSEMSEQQDDSDAPARASPTRRGLQKPPPFDDTPISIVDQPTRSIEPVEEPLDGQASTKVESAYVTTVQSVTRARKVKEEPLHASPTDQPMTAQDNFPSV